MFVKDTQDQTLIKVLDVTDLINPQNNQIQGQQQAGEEEQPPQSYEKSRLQFPSGEALPECWTNPDYKLQHSPTPQ
ncbi:MULTISPECIES: acetyltransferase [Cyanophyceae]|uniref:acetyltransferase n=1 Tax=Cyanophyceae TaxID=3028117 RepID=UPI0016833E8E|nr:MULTISPECIES: acetyltransferase [Cyanophyceae]MBD1915120.1 acetyltransferase [Phormidium sp. FACHB-77]MBD2032006.1 acetyltransferase [Phormidium sp. FACHB-322]MBD2050480.1 acetyltransferase [Leptolyngbya sp. FACHB-60]